jgi:prepilin-type N-terminal cleavage/methylation domain-containing protein
MKHLAASMTSTLRRGFTLIEVLIVVVILSILASVVIASVWRVTQDSEQIVTRSELAKVRRHVEAYRVWARGSLPQITEGVGTWGQLISPEFMTGAPLNTWVGLTNGRRIIFGTGPDTIFTGQYGWVYNPATGEVWAAGLDLAGNALPKP